MHYTCIKLTEYPRTVGMHSVTGFGRIQKEAIYVNRHIERRSCNHCCSGKALSITHSECVCVCVALGVQNSMRMSHIVICGLPHPKIFNHITS